MRKKIKEIKLNAKSGKDIGEEVTIKGWVKTVRNQKTFTFVEVNDGSCFSNLQVIVNSDVASFLEKVYF